MNSPWIKLALLVLVIGIASWGVLSFFGAGVIERATTIGGMYAVKRPDGYDAVCFVQKSSGHISCLPCSSVNNCQK